MIIKQIPTLTAKRMKELKLAKQIWEHEDKTIKVFEYTDGQEYNLVVLNTETVVTGSYLVSGNQSEKQDIKKAAWDKIKKYLTSTGR